MGADACIMCVATPRRSLADVLGDFDTLRALLHLALHTPEVLSKLREAMVLAASVEEELHGLCHQCAQLEAAAAVQRELDVCSQVGPKHVRVSVVELLEKRHERNQQRAAHLRLVTEVERG